MPVIQVTARHLCLSCRTDVIAIKTDDRLLTGYKPSMIGYGKKPSFTTLVTTALFAHSNGHQLHWMI